MKDVNCNLQITQLNKRKERLTESLKNLRNISENIRTIDSRIRVVNNNIEQLGQGTTTREDIKSETAEKLKVIIILFYYIKHQPQSSFLLIFLEHH